MDEERTSERDGTGALGLLSSILSNPNAIAGASAILSKYLSDENREGSPQSSDISEQNNIISPTNTKIHTVNEGESPTSENDEKGENSEAKDAPAGSFSSFGAKFGDARADKNRTDLLLAIRPYLSPRRQKMIDELVSLNRLTKIFKTIS